MNANQLRPLLAFGCLAIAAGVVLASGVGDGTLRKSPVGATATPTTTAEPAPQRPAPTLLVPAAPVVASWGSTSALERQAQLIPWLSQLPAGALAARSIGPNPTATVTAAPSDPVTTPAAPTSEPAEPPPTEPTPTPTPTDDHPGVGPGNGNGGNGQGNGPGDGGVPGGGHGKGGAGS